MLTEEKIYLGSRPNQSRMLPYVNHGTRFAGTKKKKSAEDKKPKKKDFLQNLIEAKPMRHQFTHLP